MSAAGMKAAAEVAAKVLTEQSKSGLAQPNPIGDQSPFHAVLEQHGLQADGQNLGVAKADIMAAFGHEPMSHPAENVISGHSLDIDVSRVPQLDSVPAGDKLTNLIKKVNNGGLQMDQIMELVSSGNRFNNRELMLLQAAMHKLAFEAELAVRVTDAGKGVVQTLVQRMQT